MKIAALSVIVGCFVSFVSSFRPTALKTVETRLYSDAKQNFLKWLEGTELEILACPETLGQLTLVRRFYGFVQETVLVEKDSGSNYAYIPDQYVDLTIKSEVDRPIVGLSLRELVGQNFFQNPFISGIYERGYRQNFENAGFPGIDKEFDEIDAFFQEGESKSVLDLSCGSGFMTRRFLKSGRYPTVIAADLSPTMLGEKNHIIMDEIFVSCES